MYAVTILLGVGMALAGLILGRGAVKDGVTAPRRVTLWLGLVCFGMGMVFATALLGL